MTILNFSANLWEDRKARKQLLHLALARHEAVRAVWYIEPAVSWVALLLTPWKELRSAERRARWRRALLHQAVSVADKVKLITPIAYLPFPFRWPDLYRLNRRIHLGLLRLRIGRPTPRHPFVAWIYHPYDVVLMDLWPQAWKAVSRFCFDWTEAWNIVFLEFTPSQQRRVERYERELVQRCDAVFVVSHSLYEIAQPLNSRAVFLPNAVAQTFIDQCSAPLPVPPELQNTPHPILGYLGALIPWVDLDLVEKVCQAFPDATLLWIGDPRWAEAYRRLSRLPNLKFVGTKRHQDLPPYLAHMDVAVSFYRPEITGTGDATKIYDFLAAGKPIVSLDNHGIFLREEIRLAGTHDAFLDHIRQALSTPLTPADLERRRILLRSHTWDARAETVLSHLHDLWA